MRSHIGTFYTHASTWQVEAIGAGGAFGVYCAASVLGGLFIYLYVPETRGLRLEQTGALFDDPYPSTWHGRSQSPYPSTWHGRSQSPYPSTWHGRSSGPSESVTRGGAKETTALLGAPAKRQGVGVNAAGV